MTRLYLSALAAATAATAVTALTHTEIASLADFTYDVVESPNRAIIKLAEQRDGLVGVTCHSDKLELSFTNTQSAQSMYASISDHANNEAKEGVVFTGHSNLCDEQPSFLLKATPEMIKSSLTLDAEKATVTFSTESAGYQHIFKDAKIRFSLSSLPETAIRQRSLADAQAIAFKTDTNRRQLSFWSTALSVAETAAQVIETGAAIAAVLRRDLSEDTYTEDVPIGTLSWNYNDNEDGAVESSTVISDGFTCTDCYLNADLGLGLEIDIKDHNITNYRVVLNGTYASQANVAITTDTTDSFGWTKQLADLSVDPITLSISDVPLTIDISCPVSFGVQGVLSKNSELSYNSNTIGTIEYGLQYIDGQWVASGDQNLTHDGGVTSLNEDTTGFVSSALTPTISVNVKGLEVSPSVTLTPQSNVIVDKPTADDYSEVKTLLGNSLSRRELSLWSAVASAGEALASGASYVSQTLEYGVDMAQNVAGIVQDVENIVDTVTDNRRELSFWSTISNIASTVSSVASTVGTVCQTVEPIASGIATIASALRRKLGDTIEVVPVDGFYAGDVFFDDVLTGTITSDCGLFTNFPSKYMEMAARVMSIDSSTVTFAVRINYGSSSDTQQAGWTCVSKNLYTWSPDDNDAGAMTIVADQDDFAVNQCSNGTTPEPLTSLQCQLMDDGSFQCSSDCFQTSSYKTRYTPQVQATANQVDVPAIVGGTIACVVVIAVAATVGVVLANKYKYSKQAIRHGATTSAAIKSDMQERF